MNFIFDRLEGLIVTNISHRCLIERYIPKKSFILLYNFIFF